MTDSAGLAGQIIGTWWLESRIDRAADGTLREDPALGSDPLAMLTYAGTHFSAQFMKRDRDSAVSVAGSGQNNTFAQGGYDAYFGTWRVIEDGQVEHRLAASITPANVGMVVLRRLAVTGQTLTIELATASTTGEAVTRTLTWRRIG